MFTCFFDSSALVKRYRNEAGSNRVEVLFDEADKKIISRLALLEVTSAIVRRARLTATSQDELTRLLDVFEREASIAFGIIELNAFIIENARHFARSYGLRSGDAIQLASALAAADESAGRRFALVASDRELNIAAAAEGLAVIDPSTQP